jgi:hypothetical protein
MTLCIAEKVCQMIFLASDSRIKLIDRYSDYAIKVVPLGISIRSPKNSVTGEGAVLYSSSFGFAFADRDRVWRGAIP